MEKEKYEISSSLPLFSRTIQGASSLLLPLEIRASFYRADDPNSADSKRLTSQTLWLSFPDGGALTLGTISSTDGAMEWAVGSGLITGTSGTTLSPAGSATRAQAAVILARFCQTLAQ